MVAMDNERPIWLVRNNASGSNADATVTALLSALSDQGIAVARTFEFPQDPLPKPVDLDAAGIETVAVFAGDGTINALVTRLAGWQGQVLVLPGGTMNLLSNLLHGAVDAPEIVARFAGGHARRRRVPVVRSVYGDAVTGILAGPGTAWNDVREALRHGDVIDMTGSAATAIGESTKGAMVFCHEPAVGREQGYSILMLTPHESGIIAEGYFAETLTDYTKQGFALLRRNFRDGPHDDLGLFAEIAIRAADDADIGLLIDGEPAAGQSHERFTLGRSVVEFAATADIAG